MPTKPKTRQYGKACTECNRAKVRCVVESAGKACERCLRIGADCVPGAAARSPYRNNTQLGPSTSELEAKLNALLTMLSAGSRDISRLTPIVSVHWPAAHSPVAIPTPIAMDLPSPSVSTRSPADARRPATSPFLDSQPLPTESEDYFRTFQATRLHFLPMLDMPQTMTSARLREEKPFLWFCIMAVETKSTTRQMEMYSVIRKTIAQKLVTELERSLDLLQGLLVCIAWSNLQVRRQPFLTTYTQLANSLIYGFGLNKAPRPTLDEESRYRFHTPHVASGRTLEERRALLTCYYLNSSISVSLRVIDPIRWTPHMEESLAVLSNANECTGDLMLVALVRLQRVIESAQSSPWADEERLRTSDPKLLAAPRFYLKALLAELTTAIESIPIAVQNDDTLKLLVESAKVSVYETYLSKHLTGSATLAFERIEALRCCLRAAQSWFDIFFTLPPASYVGMPITLFLHLGHCAATLFKLSVLDDPCWDRREAARLADVVAIGTRFAENCAQVAALTGIRADGNEPDVFSHATTLMQKAAANWAARLREDSDQLDEGVGTSGAADVDPMLYETGAESWSELIFGM